MKRSAMLMGMLVSVLALMVPVASARASLLAVSGAAQDAAPKDPEGDLYKEFYVANNAKDIQVGTLKGHNASGIAGQASEFVELRAIHLNFANLYVLYGCAAPTATSGVVCLIGGNGFATNLSGPVAQIAGNLRKATISGVVDSDLVLEVDASIP